MSRTFYLDDTILSMKKTTPAVKSFGKKIAEIRGTRGLSQRQLAKLTGISYRVIAYYEAQTKHPPTHLIVPLVKALGVSADELLGIKKFEHPFDGQHPRLWSKLSKAALLPKEDQQTLLKNLDDLLAKNRIKR